MNASHSGHTAQPGHSSHSPRHPYLRLLAMVALSFLAMYVLMYAMVDALANVLPSLNQAYMAGLMSAPMLVLELLLMRHMYPDRRFNAALMAAGVLLLLLCWTGIRQQAAIGDEQFLKSMIPHHAGAVLMCEQAPLRDPEVKDLCTRIIASPLLGSLAGLGLLSTVLGLAAQHWTQQGRQTRHPTRGKSISLSRREALRFRRVNHKCGLASKPQASQGRPYLAAPPTSSPMGRQRVPWSRLDRTKRGPRLTTRMAVGLLQKIPFLNHRGA